MAKAIGTTTRMRAVYAAGSAALAIAIATPAFAADKAPAADDTTKEIVVTAQFRSQKLQDTPLSITAVSADLLKSRNQTDISQIAAQAPNVALTPMGGAYGSSMGASIRGIGQLDFNPAYEPGVGMYIDDVYYATLTGGVFDLLDLDRVEVLRGPQGTLTGRNSIGGAIKLFTKKPDASNSGNVEAAYGSRNRVDLRASANFVLADGLYGRVSGVYKRQDGYVDQVDYGCKFPTNTLGIARNPASGGDCVLAKLGERNYSGIRASLRYAPNDKLDWTVTGDYSYENRTNAAEVLTSVTTTPFNSPSPTFICGNFCTYANFTAPAGGSVTGTYSMPNHTKFSGWGVSSNLKYNVSDSVNLQSITAYREYKTTWGTDDDFSPSTTDIGQGFNDLRFHFLSQELRLNGKIGTAAEWTLGGFISDQKSVYYTIQDIRYIGTLQFVGNDPVKAHSKAVFGTVIVHPAPALTVTGGLRYTGEHKDYTFSRKNLDGTVSTALGALDGFTAIYNGNKLDWRLSADYRWNPQVLTYVTIGTGFKGGGVTARPFDVAQARNGSFNPETVTAYEVGVKTDLLDRKLRMNLSAFINDYKNRQLPLSSCAGLGSSAPCGAVQNAGSGKIQGLEAEISATPVSGFNIDGSISYMDGHWNNIAAAVGSSYQLGDPIVTPKWKWSIGAQYRADLGESGSLTPRFDLNYTGQVSAGRTAVSGGNLAYYPSLTLGNARLTWKNKAEDLAVSLEVQNVFDKYYQPITFAAVYGFTGTAYSQVGRPREWAISVRKTF